MISQASVILTRATSATARLLSAGLLSMLSQAMLLFQMKIETMLVRSLVFQAMVILLPTLVHWRPVLMAGFLCAAPFRSHVMLSYLFLSMIFLAMLIVQVVLILRLPSLVAVLLTANPRQAPIVAMH